MFYTQPGARIKCCNCWQNHRDLTVSQQRGRGWGKWKMQTHSHMPNMCRQTHTRSCVWIGGLSGLRVQSVKILHNYVTLVPGEVSVVQMWVAPRLLMWCHRGRSRREQWRGELSSIKAIFMITDEGRRSLTPNTDIPILPAGPNPKTTPPLTSSSIMSKTKPDSVTLLGRMSSTRPKSRWWSLPHASTLYCGRIRFLSLLCKLCFISHISFLSAAFSFYSWNTLSFFSHFLTKCRHISDCMAVRKQLGVRKRKNESWLLPDLRLDSVDFANKAQQKEQKSTF